MNRYGMDGIPPGCLFWGLVMISLLGLVTMWIRGEY